MFINGVGFNTNSYKTDNFSNKKKKKKKQENNNKNKLIDENIDNINETYINYDVNGKLIETNIKNHFDNKA